MSSTLVARSPITPHPPVTVEAGWEVSRRRSTADLRLIDATPLTKVLLRAPEVGPTADAVRVGHGASIRTDGMLLIGSGPGEWLALAAPGSADDVTGWLRALCDPSEHTSVIDLTHGRALMGLTGARASDTLAKLCAIDLHDDAVHDGGAFRSSVARVATDVVRADEGGVRSYLLHCERSSGQYLFDAVLDAGREFAVDVDGFRAPGI